MLLNLSYAAQKLAITNKHCTEGITLSQHKMGHKFDCYLRSDALENVHAWILGTDLLQMHIDEIIIGSYL